jgi:hypothetical protein
VINTLFNNVPNRASDFIIGIVDEAEMPLKKQLLGVLKEVDENSIIELYRTMVLSESAFLRIHGLMGLSKMSIDDANNVIISAVNDPSSSVRRLVANFISCPGTNSEMAALVRLSSDADETVARIAIKKMGRTRQHRFAFVNLIPKLLHPNVSIRKEAIEALRDITGTDLGYNFSDDEYKRREAVVRWEELWDKNQTNPNFLKDLKRIVLEEQRKVMEKAKKKKK